MKVFIDNLEIPYGENVRLIRTFMKREHPQEYHELFKWKLQLLYFDETSWIEICRIDNYPHHNQRGSHIHMYKRKNVKFAPMNFEVVETLIKQLGARLIHKHFGESVMID